MVRAAALTYKLSVSCVAWSIQSTSLLISQFHHLVQLRLVFQSQFESRVADRFATMKAKNFLCFLSLTVFSLAYATPSPLPEDSAHIVARDPRRDIFNGLNLQHVSGLHKRFLPIRTHSEPWVCKRDVHVSIPLTSPFLLNKPLPHSMLHFPYDGLGSSSSTLL